MFDLTRPFSTNGDPKAAALLDDMNSAWAQAWLNVMPKELREQCNRDNQEVLRRVFFLGFAAGSRWQKEQP